MFVIFQVKIINDKNEITDIGEKGEILARGFAVMKGYWEDDTKTGEFLTETNWGKTG